MPRETCQTPARTVVEQPRSPETRARAAVWVRPGLLPLQGWPWTGLAALELRGLHVATSPVSSVTGAVVTLLLATRATLRLCWRVDPTRERVRLGLQVEVGGTDPSAAEARTRTVLGELERVLEGHGRHAWSAVCGPEALEALCHPRFAEARLGVPGLGASPEPRFLDEVLELALEQPGPVELSITLGPDRLDRSARMGVVSAQTASREAALQGVRFHTREGVWATLLPDDQVQQRLRLVALREEATWLTSVDEGAVQVRIALASDAPLDRALLAATRRYALGRKGRWLQLTADQAAELRHGPGTALACPGIDPWELAVPGALAAALLELPEAAPEGVPELGPRPRSAPATLLAPRDGALLGLAASAGGDVPVRLAPNDLARHLWLCGQTGTGKSTVLLTLLRDLVARGEGVGLIDPHGDLAEELRAGLDRPVHVFDPTDDDCPGLDPLDHPDGEARALEQVASILFQVVCAQHMGPVFERYSRALLTLLLAAGEPLTELSRLTWDEGFRRRCLRTLRRGEAAHDEARWFWRGEFSDWGYAHKASMNTYVVSKFDGLLRSSPLRRLAGRGRRQLDVRGILERGEVLVARLPAGELGPVTAWFAGLLLLGRIQAATFERVRRPERPPFTLAIDEFHTLLQGYSGSHQERSLSPLLSEARKFGLRLVLANQYVGQLETGTRTAVLGNVGNLLMFRQSQRDARLLVRELGIGLVPEELSRLPNFRAVARVLRDGSSLAPFHLHTLAPEK